VNNDDDNNNSKRNKLVMSYHLLLDHHRIPKRHFELPMTWLQETLGPNRLAEGMKKLK
jgi:hypothetical protein